MPLLALLALFSSSAQAGGYYFPDSGVVAVGRGGAFVASADDTFAQYYNPAALVRLERWTFDVGVSAVSQQVEFSRLMEDDTLAEPVSNEGGAFIIPQFAVGGPLVEDKLHLAVGLYTAYSPSFSYEPEGPQRYTLIDSSIWQAFAGPSLSYTPHPAISVGLGLQWQFLSVGQDLAVTTSLVEGRTEDPSSDVNVSVRQFDPFAPSANLGLLVRPVDELSVGLAAQLPSSFRARGSLVADFSGHALEAQMQDPVIEDDSVNLGVRLPLVLKAGVAVHPREDSAIELAMVYENWKSLDSLVLSDLQLDLNFTNPNFPAPEVSEELALPAAFRDVFSLRLGGTVRVIDELTLRGGGFWERGSQEDARVSVAAYDPNKWQASAGASVHLLDERLTVDTSLAYLFFPAKSVRNSTVSQTNVQDGPVSVVGNGDYRSSGLVLAAGVSWAFGRSDQ